MEGVNMSGKFVVKHSDLETKADKTVNITVRIDKHIQEEFDELASKSNHSRNKLIEMALQYALDNLEFIDKK